ncbi:MAG: nucleotidyltransferase family protein [Bacteroidota bacterium]
MTPSLSDKTKQTIASELQRRFKIKSIILFGSHANGTPNKESDVDLVVVLDRGGSPASYMDRINLRASMAEALGEIEKDYGLDVLAYTSDEWDSLVKAKSSFTRSILSTGVILV